MRPGILKSLYWIASSLHDLRKLPEAARDAVGYALFVAQTGGKHESAKPLHGFGGAGVLEIVEDDDGSTYRAVYTVKFASAVYVLDVFQKKSKTGRKTAKQDIDRIRTRLKYAEADHKERHAD